MTGTAQHHGSSPDWVIRESLRIFPLDLASRVKWIDGVAHYTTDEADRHEIMRRLRVIRNGVS